MELNEEEMFLIRSVFELVDDIGNVGCSIDKVDGKLVMEFDIG